MENFVFTNPTKLIFGRGQITQLRTELQPYKRILLVYGGGSIKRSGLYDEVITTLNDLGAQVHELPGVEPNPRLSTANRGVQLCRQEQIDFILAVGGGSVIDCVKAIAVGARFEGDVWAVITKKATATGALPFGTILTLAATGSEMNPGSVITNWETKEKVGWNAAPYSYPTFSICDPVYTFTVPRDQTVYGIVDMMSHALETYFPGATNTPLQDRWIEGLLRTVIEAAPRVLADPESYEARETLLYCSTMALNRFVSIGTIGDWATHSMEHAVSAVYDIPHGGGLAILFPNWMQYCLDAKPERFAQLAVRLFDVEPAGRSDRAVGLEGIERLRAFWSGIGAPSRLADYQIDADQIEVMAAKATPNGPIGRTRRLAKEDVAEIYRLSL
ncbi:MAG TPA: iron-containing alcohol dehydrogenase [Symbiobacteriaceae bacterium]|nr:iron-containing alcohol dehydrogenase [Symbiobacteriaceae bacterium]